MELGPLVDVRWLRAHLDDVVVADVRWYLDGRSGREAYDRGHLPHAVFIDLDTDLSAPPGTRGRHPLPDAAHFAAVMRRAGVNRDTPVIAYDDSGGGTAARLWWMLDALGHPAAVLDGGVDAWAAPLTTEAPTPEPGTFPDRLWPRDRFPGADAVATLVDEHPVIDARSADRYRGEPNGIDPRFGHIPGALNMPWTDNLADGALRPAPVLAAQFTAAGVEAGSDPIFYCGSGVTACADLLAWRHAGNTGGRLYVGSWSEWGADPDRPLETGGGGDHAP